MSYLKLPKTTSDHAVGFQSLNQAIDNNAALLDSFDGYHAIGVGGNFLYGGATRSPGRHNDILIARTTADFDVDLTTATPTLYQKVSGPLIGVQFLRMGTGQWRIYLLTAQRIAAVALMKSTGSADRKATCYVTYDPTASIFVSTWNVATPATEDLPFSLAIWADAP